MASIVYKVGEEVSSDIKEGMRVFLIPCTSKRPDCGLSLFEIADECGAFSQYVQVQDAQIGYNIFLFPENVSFDVGALVEPFAVAMHGVNIGGGKPGDKVVIFGDGMIGLSTYCALGMANQGACLVIVALYHNNIEINPYEIVASEMNVLGSFAYQTQDIKDVISCLEAESTPIEKIITHHFPLDKINEAFDVEKNEKDTLKVIIDHES